MSGDNLHGKQPIKFYSEKITLTKVELLERQLSLGEKVSDLDEKHKEWSRRLSNWTVKKIHLHNIHFFISSNQDFSINYWKIICPHTDYIFLKKTIFLASSETFYLTFLNFGVLKNITLKLKNKIVIVRAGRIYRIKSELNREGILAKIKCK